MKKIGVVIINYKNYAERFLTDCAASLRSQNFDGDLNIYLIDNASTPETWEYLKKNFPEAKIISRPDGNYCAANNLGLRQAFADGCEAGVVANMDTVFDRSWLKELVAASERHPNAGIIQSLILLHSSFSPNSSQQLINSTGNLNHYLGFGFTQNYQKYFCAEDWREDWELTGYASGCSLMITKDCWQKIGDYNEEYYMYHDDIEMGARARLAGFKIFLAPRSLVWHKFEFARSNRMIFFQERNRWLFMFHYYPWWAIVLFAPMGLCLEIGMIGYSLKNHWFSEKMRACVYFLKWETWTKIAKFRKELRNIRLLIWADFFRNFEGEVKFQEIDNIILSNIGNPLMSAYWRIVRKLIAP